MNTSHLAISLVLFKTNETIFKECADCILKLSFPVSVCVVDNSPDNNLKTFVNQYNFDYIHLPNNPGYGAGHNVALQKSINADITYHLVLNADVQFPPDTIEKMVSYMDNNSKIALLMPKVLNSDGTIQRLCKLVPTPFDLILRRFLPNSLTQNRRRYFELWDCGYDKITFVPYLSGCFMLLRVEALKEVGLFDERFFMYPEDIDLTRRLASRFDTVFYPDVSITHLHDAASYKSVRMLLIHIFNIIKYFNKWGWFFDENRRALNKKTRKLILKSLNE